MVRYDKEHKQATRQRIIETAGHRFKQDGIDGSGVATLMADAGLTNGAFYAHFASKDDLVATRRRRPAGYARRGVSVRWRPAGRAWRSSSANICRLSTGTTPAHGCPSAALLDEIGRCAAGTKHAYTDGLRAILDEIAARLAPEDPQSARGRRSGSTRWRWARCNCPAPCPTRVRRRGPRTGHPERPRVPSLRTADHPGGALELGDLPSHAADQIMVVLSWWRRAGAEGARPLDGRRRVHRRA